MPGSGCPKPAKTFRTAYSNLLDQEVIGLQFSIPLFDWGMGKGRVRMAKARADMVRNQIEQDETDLPAHNLYADRAIPQPAEPVRRGRPGTGGR